jgi:hypothetical protein
MELLLLAIVTAMALARGSASLAQEGATPEGEWTTFDDRSGAAREQVRISIREARLTGVIERIFLHPGEVADSSLRPLHRRTPKPASRRNGDPPWLQP